MKCNYLLKILVSNLTIILIGYNSLALAQKSYSIDIVKDSLVCDLTDSLILNGNKDVFSFPPYTFRQHQKDSAIQAERLYDENQLKISVKADLSSLSKNVYFVLNTFMKNIDYLEVGLMSGNRYMSIQKIKTNNCFTYQPTIYIAPDYDFWNNIDLSQCNIILTGITKDAKHAELILGRLEVISRFNYKQEHFSNIDQDAIDDILNYNIDYKYNEYVLWGNALFTSAQGGTYTPYLSFNNCESLIDSLNCISSLINDVVIQSFGSKTEQNKYTIGLDEITVNSLSIDDYYKKIIPFINRLNNCHFRFQSGYKSESSMPKQPIYFHSILNTIQVVGIFNADLVDIISLGDILIQINNIPINDLLPILGIHISASSSHHRNDKLIQQLLYYSYNYFNNDLSLLLQNENGYEYEVHIPKKKLQEKQTIPSNFKTTKPYVCEQYNNVAYLRLSLFENMLLPFLYSNKHVIDNASGLVIDLRGINASDLSIIPFFAASIDKPTPFITNAAPNLDFKKPLKYNTIVVKPSPYLRLNKPIIFIVDSKTTCGAEILISSIQAKSKEVYVIGNGPSAGGAQFVQRIVLPLNKELVFFQGDLTVTGNKNIDNSNGIVPDIIVPIQTYNDLAPYNDIVKMRAIEFMNSYLEN